MRIALLSLALEMKTNMNNYFSVNRGLLFSDRWLSEPFSRGQAWVDLFGLAQHTDSFMRVRGIKVEIKRGQLGYSQLTLAKRWRWSRNKVIRYLKELEKEGDIEQQNNAITTLITVTKYNQWQLGGTTDDTTEGQQKDNRRDTYKKDKKDKNEKKESSVSFLNFFEAYAYKKSKQKAIKAWEKITEREKLAIMEYLPKYIASTKTDGTYPSRQHPSTFLNQRTWEDEITEKQIDTTGWSQMKMYEHFGVEGMKKHLKNNNLIL